MAQPGLLREGFRRVWHYQRVLWFIFFFNVLLAHFGSPLTHKLEGVTDRSLEAQRLVGMFDLGTFSALASNPEVKLFNSVGGVSVSFSLVFFGIVFFLTGGILEAYRADRKLTTREFFEACGSYFWRFVRLLVLMGMVLVPVVIAATVAFGMISLSALDASEERTFFWIFVGATAAIVVVMMSIRLWFDLAQVRAVVEEDYRMFYNARDAFHLTFRNFGTLFWMYFRISALGWIVLAAGLYVWAKMPPARFGWTLLILEFVIVFGFGARLWQRACEMVWYQRQVLARVTAFPSAPPSPPAPDPLLTIAPAPLTPPQ